MTNLPRLAAIAAAILAGLCLAYLSGLNRGTANYGFGPDWDCTPQPKGGPTCTRRVPR